MARYTYIPNRVIDSDGISDGATITVYRAGTTTPVSIYSDSALTTPLTNPYTVAAGAAVPAIYYADNQRVRVLVQDDAGATISDDDPYGSVFVEDVLDFVIPSGTTATEVQAAIDTGKTVYLGSAAKTYTISTPLTMNANQRIYADGATLQAGAAIDQILTLASGAIIEGITFDANNTQPVSGVPITQTGAARCIRLLEINGCRVRRCKFTKYVRGVSVTSETAGVECYDHNFVDCEAIAGFTWDDSRTSSNQLAAYVGSEASPTISPIENYGNSEPECEDVHSVRFIGWRAFEGQYGLALHRCSNVSVTGGQFRRMSRGISIQHQSRGITVTGGVFQDLDTTGVHMAQGVSQVTVVGNRFHGTMANDNAAVQAYYGVREITIADNVFDSRFDTWDGGPSSDTRVPQSAIRIGQQARNITISGNQIRGYAYGVYAKTTIYETILDTDDNYYNTGFRDLRIYGNTFIGDYFTTATGFKGNFPQNGSYGVRLHISGTWEDVAGGGWDVEGITVENNTADGVGYSYVAETATMSGGANPPEFLSFAVRFRNNRSLNAGVSDVVRTTVANAIAVTYEGNTWVDEQAWTPDIVGTGTAGTQTYATRAGYWAARGGRIIVHGRIVLTAKDGTINGNPVIEGLPADVKNVNNRAGSVSLWGGWTLAANFTYLGIYAEPNTDQLRIVRCGSGQAAAFPSVTEMGATAQIDFTCEYEPVL